MLNHAVEMSITHVDAPFMQRVGWHIMALAHVQSRPKDGHNQHHSTNDKLCCNHWHHVMSSKKRNKSSKLEVEWMQCAYAIEPTVLTLFVCAF